MSSTKLNPIYDALDAHQFGRAIKLADALPDSHVLGKALLAHAYVRSGQRHAALLTLHKLLGGSFYELQHELANDLESTLERHHGAFTNPKAATTTTAAAAAPEPAAATTNKKGKKGKKKPAAPKDPSATDPANSSSSAMDLMDQLNTPPTLPERLDDFPPPEQAITDETTLATLAVSLQSLKFPLTTYQLYSWAVTAAPPTDVTLRKTFCHGLHVLASPPKWAADSQARLEEHVLSHMQAIALQYARLLASSSSPSSSLGGGQHHGMNLATAWAAQVALWQLQWLPEDDRRQRLLPRLAESMAKRIVDGETANGRQSAEARLLYLRILESQSKWEEMLQTLEDLNTVDNDKESDGTVKPPPPSPEFGMALTKNQILNEKARILRKLGRCKECRDVFENLLLENPDDWSCWKGHLESSIFDDDINATQSLVDRILKKQEDAPFPLRGPYLMLVEIVTEKVRKSATPEAIQACAAAIQKYAGIFAPRVSCAFSDLENYVNMIVRSNDEAAMEATVALINFAETLRKSSATAKESDKYTNKERQSKLRAYTFAVKLMHKLLASRPDLCKRYLPDWKELVVEWRTSLSLIPSSGGEERRDMKAGDELILLIAQQLLYSGADQASLMVCSSLLEDAIANSTDNPYLKFAAIDVYHQLDAVSRAWELYDSIGIKHIQNDTCNFTIISRLLEGGLYNEVISICSQLLSFQTCTPRECGEYAGRAMECGTLSKSNEFLVFQREKMNSSLTLHYCKGAILDAAPLFATAVPGKDEGDFVMKGGLGIQQGIVGGDDDVERAINLLVHSHSPYASVSVVSWVHCFGSLDHADSLADNRDTSVLTQNAILVPPKIEKKGFMIQETLRRGHVHGILIRTALCLDAMKGPKKGKVGKPSECLKKRINSLLESVLSASEFFDTQVVFDDYENGAGCQAMLRTFLELCRVLAVIISGLPKSEEDSMEHREQSATDMLQKHATAQIKLAHENLTGTWNIKTVCSMSASYLVPVFAVFRMCSTACTIYGWGKRKQTKKVSLAMAEFSQTLNELVQDMMACVKTLPESDTAMIECPLKEEVAEIVGVEGLKKAKTIVTICQYRTRLRLEPVLQEMDEFLDEFDASKEK